MLQPEQQALGMRAASSSTQLIAVHISAVHIERTASPIPDTVPASGLCHTGQVTSSSIKSNPPIVLLPFLARPRHVIDPPRSSRLHGRIGREMRLFATGILRLLGLMGSVQPKQSEDGVIEIWCAVYEDAGVVMSKNEKGIGAVR